jgi:hypothetical protein
MLLRLAVPSVLLLRGNQISLRSRPQIGTDSAIDGAGDGERPRYEQTNEARAQCDQD